MKLINLKNFVLIIIVVVGALLRFYKLSQIPNGFYIDEAAIGYNSYSLLKTGEDEYGKSFPIFLKSFNAYSSPLYAYLSTIPIALFGLNVFSVRFLSAFLGSLSILIFYGILGKIKIIKKDYIRLLGAFIFAISPWNIFFSRGAYEANLALFMILLSFYLFLDESKKYWKLLLSISVLSLSTYAYQANRLISFTLLPLIIVKRGRKDLLNKKNIIAVLIFCVIQIPQFVLLFTPAFRSRAVGLFYMEQILTQTQKIEYFLPSFIAYPLSFAREFFAQLVAYFSPRNLFWEGDSDLQRSIPELGVFYPWMVIPYLVGIFSLFREKRREISIGIFALAFLFSLPAALTRDPFSTLRALPLSSVLLIIIIYGIDKMLLFRLSLLWKLYFVITIPLSIVFLWRSYFVLFPNERAVIWGYGQEELIMTIKRYPEKKFIIDQTRTKPLYIQYLFFTKYEPEKFHGLFSENIRKNYYDSLTFSKDYEIENIRFSAIDWESDIYKEQIIVGDDLAISEPQAKEHFLDKVFEINDPQGNIVFIGFETHPYEKCKSISFKNDKCDVYIQ